MPRRPYPRESHPELKGFQRAWWLGTPVTPQALTVLQWGPLPSCAAWLSWSTSPSLELSLGRSHGSMVCVFTVPTPGGVLIQWHPLVVSLRGRSWGVQRPVAVRELPEKTETHAGLELLSPVPSLSHTRWGSGRGSNL